MGNFKSSAVCHFSIISSVPFGVMGYGIRRLLQNIFFSFCGIVIFAAERNVYEGNGKQIIRKYSHVAKVFWIPKQCNNSLHNLCF